jgi:hypothetical protein
MKKYISTHKSQPSARSSLTHKTYSPTAQASGSTNFELLLPHSSPGNLKSMNDTQFCSRIGLLRSCVNDHIVTNTTNARQRFGKQFSAATDREEWYTARQRLSKCAFRSNERCNEICARFIATDTQNITHEFSFSSVRFIRKRIQCSAVEC